MISISERAVSIYQSLNRVVLSLISYQIFSSLVTSRSSFDRIYWSVSLSCRTGSFPLSGHTVSNLIFLYSCSAFTFSLNIAGVIMVLYMFCNIFTYVITKYCYVTDENIDERIEGTLIDDDDQPIKLIFLAGQKIGKIMLDNKMMKFFTILCRSLWKCSTDHAQAPTILHAFLQVHKQNYLPSYEFF